MPNMLKRAFTLIEVLISIFIMSLITIMTMRSMSSFVKTKYISENSIKSIDDLSRALALIDTDLMHAYNLTGIRGAFILPEFVGKPAIYDCEKPFLSFARSKEDDNGTPQLPIEVGYFLCGNSLLRGYRYLYGDVIWNKSELLGNIIKLSISYGSSGSWKDEFHAGSYNKEPYVIKFNIHTKSMRNIVRIMKFA